VDGQSIEDFEKDLRNNLYRIWNRMSSGTYFPPPVLQVDIPKADGGTRTLGLPTVADRVAQTVVALTLEPRTESIFVDDSYGYRPGKSALDAVAACRQRCWRKDWVIDLDLQKFFDSVPWELIEKAVVANITQERRWVLLYVPRWLAAPMQTRDGTIIERGRGSPQGSAVSPVLANLFMHYAFDTWLAREFPTVEFERYADDAVVHCATKRQAESVLAALEERMEQVGVRLHLDKTKIVYCKEESRRGEHEHTSFVFLGYEFRGRSVKGKEGRMHVSFTPAVSPKALKAMGRVVRSWRLHLSTGTDLNDLAKQINPIVAGWMNYYGRYNRSELHPLLRRINTYLMRWAQRKYKRLHAWKRLWRWWTGILDRDPGLFMHWAWERMSSGYR
jgi:RNA-directed DNA polymerase